MIKKPGKGEDLGLGCGWVLHSQEVGPQGSLKDAEQDVNSSGGGLGTRRAYFEEEEKTREVLSKSSSQDAEGSDKDK